MENFNAGTLAGFLVMLISFALPLWYRSFREDALLLVVFWSLLFLYQTVALINAFYATTYGAGVDALTFYENASALASSGGFQLLYGHGSSVYENYLGVLYSLFGSSLFLASELPVFAFTFASIYLIQISRITGLFLYRRWIMFFFGMLPTMWLLSSVPLREAYQYLFFILTVYFGIKMHFEKKFYLLFPVLFFAVCMGLFHKGLVLFIIPLVVILSFVEVQRPFAVLKGGKVALKFKLLLYGMLVFFAFFVAFIVFRYPDLIHNAPREILSGKAFEFIQNYRIGDEDHRATYGIDFNYDDNFVLIISFIKMIFYYFFYPFPWKVENFKDVYAMVENFWRLLLIISSLFLVYKSEGNNRRIYVMLLVLYFLNSSLWAIGTKNYGTAIRHHIVPYWIIVLLGAPIVSEYLKMLFVFIRSKLTLDKEGLIIRQNS